MNPLISTTGAANAPNIGRGSVPGRKDAECRIFTMRTTTRVFMPLLWLFFLFAFAAQTANAQDENFPAGNGDGSEGAPFQITSAAELAQLATLVNAGDATYNAAHYKLMNDLDLNVAPYNEDTGWTPIGVSVANDATHSFQGVFEGNNKVVTGLYINDASIANGNIGLFGCISNSTIQNLGIEGANVTGNGFTGILAGCAFTCTINNCHTSGTVNGGANNRVGGLTGNVMGASCTVSDCYSTATVTTVAGSGFVGGLIGYFNTTNTSTITNCHTTGNVHATNGSGGGLAGGIINVNISSSYATGNVTGNSGDLGGLVGYCNASRIANCYATGTVTVSNTGTYYIGGLVGSFRGGASAFSSIENCFATGAVTGGVAVGGILGGNGDSTPGGNTSVTNCVALNPGVTSTASSVIGSAKGDNAATLVNVLAFNGMTLAGAQDAQRNGAGKTANEIRAAGFFEGLFADDPAWTYETGKLPGLNGETVDMPDYIKAEPFELSESGEYNFPREAPGYGAVEPLNVTVSNNFDAAIGPLTIELDGADAESFELSATGIASIAANGESSFTVAPKTGLTAGIYTAIVTVTESASGYYLSFAVNFSIAAGQNSGIPDVSWYDEGETTFRISYPDELAGLAQLVNSGTTFAGKTVILGNDIDLSVYGKEADWNSGAGWVRIGNSTTNPFSGEFNGDNKYITGLYIHLTAPPAGGDSHSHGLFGVVANGAVIKNLIISDADINVSGVGGDALVAILAGRVQGGVLENCHLSGSVSVTGNRAGSLIGSADTNPCNVSNCSSTASVNVQSGYGGGLIGLFAHGTISNSYAIGNVNTSNGSTGGLVGWILNANTAVISSCYALGNVASNDEAVGGLVGRASGTVEIENCYATGVIVGTIAVGGITGVGAATVTITDCAALSPGVTSANNSVIGRMMGDNAPVLVNCLAFNGMILTGVQDDQRNGTDVTAAEIVTAGFFEDLFADDPAWTFETGKLPGLNGVPVDMPNHLKVESFNLSESGEYAFPREEPGYGAVEPLSVTVTNKLSAAIGPLTIELDGANAEIFELSATGIASIAASGESSFTVTPKTGLTAGIYTATVTVTESNSGYYLSFDVNFSIAAGQNSGIPDISWYDDGETTFRISYPDELAGLAQLVNSGKTFAGKTVILDNDIDLSVYGQGWNDGKGWTSIGFDTNNSFRGVFNGGGYTITGLYINTNVNHQGLFGFVFQGVINDLTIADADVTVTITSGDAMTGILAGRIQGCTIENCHSSGTVTTNSNRTGGLIGSSDSGSSAISNSSSSATVTTHTSNSYGGGLIGYMVGGNFDTDPGRITDCYATGDISTTNGSTGGLAGWVDKVRITSCYATGNVESNGGTAVTHVGGLVGRIQNAALIENCYATGTVASTENVGGIVGGFTGAGDVITISGCAALNPGVIALNTNTSVGRVMGNPTNGTTFSGNMAFSGMTNIDGTTEWGECLAGNKNGADKTSAEIREAGFFEELFASAPQDVWTFETGKLPGLNGEPVDLPPHLAPQAEVPDIIEQPQGSQIMAGETYTLSVTAESADGGELSYQWYSNSGASIVGGEAIDGATDNTYTPDTETEGTYYFYVVVTNTINNNGVENTATATSNVATLQVTSVPTFAVTVLAGSGATGAGNYAENETVNISAGTPAAGQAFMNWTVTSGNATLDDANSAATSFIMPDGAVTVTANFGYIVKYEVINGDGAMNSTISATYDGVSIDGETVVSGGKTLVVTASGADPVRNVYTYVWSGTASGTGATYTTTVNAAVDAICTVTGSRITGVEELPANPLKAWISNNVLHVSGIAEGKVWKLYSVSGALVKQGIAGNDVVTVSLELPGVYVIQSEGNTLKFVY